MDKQFDPKTCSAEEAEQFLAKHRLAVPGADPQPETIQVDLPGVGLVPLAQASPGFAPGRAGAGDGVEALRSPDPVAGAHQMSLRDRLRASQNAFPESSDGERLEFTPGPWQAREWACHAASTVLSGDTVVAECSGHGRHAVESIADANLIAAAPEMYEALKGAQIMIGFLLEYAELHRSFTKASKRNANVTRIKIMDALAKADGRVL